MFALLSVGAMIGVGTLKNEDAHKVTGKVLDRLRESLGVEQRI